MLFSELLLPQFENVNPDWHSDVREKLATRSAQVDYLHALQHRSEKGGTSNLGTSRLFHLWPQSA